jgi:hypothetical protein
MSSPPPSWPDAVTAVLVDQLNPDTVTTVCSILGNRRRQLVVLYLLTCDSNEWVTLTELARWIAAVTTNSSLEEARGSDYSNVREALRQTHLPTLADADVITYDADRTRLSPSDHLPLIGRLLFHLLIVSTTCKIDSP